MIYDTRAEYPDYDPFGENSPLSEANLSRLASNSACRIAFGNGNARRTPERVRTYTSSYLTLGVGPHINEPLLLGVVEQPFWLANCLGSTDPPLRS